MQSMPKRPPLATGSGLVSSHRMNAQILSPSVSTCTDAGGPISLPPGSLAHSPPGTAGPPPSASPLTGRYGLSVGPWAKRTTSVAKNAVMADNTIHPARVTFGMTHLSYRIEFSRILTYRVSKSIKDSEGESRCENKSYPYWWFKSRHWLFQVQAQPRLLPPCTLLKGGASVPAARTTRTGRTPK